MFPLKLTVTINDAADLAAFLHASGLAARVTADAAPKPAKTNPAKGNELARGASETAESATAGSQQETANAGEAPGKPSTGRATTASSTRTAEVVKADAPAASASTSSSAHASSTTTPPADASGASLDDVAYADLQKAILKLHKLDPNATLAIAKNEFGLDNFKPLKEDATGERRAKALSLIEAKLAELEG